MKVITVNGHKGGIGKSTLSVVTAAGLAARGRRVLLMDTDPQAHITESFNLEAEPGLYQVLVRHDDILDYLRRPAPETYQIPGEDIQGRLYILPNNEESAAIPGLVKDARVLAQHLSPLEDAVDYVVIDTPPSPGLLMAVIYHATDYVIVPTELARLSFAGMLATLRSIQGFDKKLLGIVVNKYERKVVLHNHKLKQLVKAAYENSWHLFSPLRKCVIWEEASEIGSVVWTLNAETQSGRTAQAEALKFAEQVMGALAHEEEKQSIS